MPRCCGRQTGAARSSSLSKSVAGATSSAVQRVQLEYTGEVNREIRFQAATGQLYSVNKSRTVISAHPADVAGLIKVGFQQVGGKTEEKAAEKSEVVADEKAPSLIEESAEIPAINATDAAKELAAGAGLDMLTIDGTGSGGKITKTDVQKVIDGVKSA